MKWMLLMIAEGMNERLKGCGLATVEREADGSFYIYLEVDHYGDLTITNFFKKLKGSASHVETIHEKGFVLYKVENIAIYAVYDFHRFIR